MLVIELHFDTLYYQPNFIVLFKLQLIPTIPKLWLSIPTEVL